MSNLWLVNWKNWSPVSYKRTTDRNILHKLTKIYFISFSTICKIWSRELPDDKLPFFYFLDYFKVSFFPHLFHFGLESYVITGPNIKFQKKKIICPLFSRLMQFNHFHSKWIGPLNLVDQYLRPRNRFTNLPKSTFS